MLCRVAIRVDTAVLLPGLVLAMSAAAGRAQDSESSDKWSYEIIPYVWGAGIDGREGLGHNTANVSASAKDLFEFVNVGGSLRLTGHGGRLGWYGEVSYVGLEDDTTSAAGAVRVKSSQTLAELGMSLDIVQALGLSAYAGIRYQDQNAVLEAVAQRQESDHSWVDALVGAKWELATQHLVGWVRADIGTGGSKFVWLGEIGGGLRFASRWSVYLSYRVLDTDYDRDNFLYNLRLNGLLLGFGAKF
jgi:hypothetical protein